MINSDPNTIALGGVATGNIKAQLAAIATLIAANDVLNNPNFRYISEFTDQNKACLVFETKLDDMEVTGIDLIEWNDEEKMVKLSVFIRPFSALTKVGEHMSMKLNAMS